MKETALGAGRAGADLTSETGAAMERKDYGPRLRENRAAREELREKIDRYRICRSPLPRLWWCCSSSSSWAAR